MERFLFGCTFVVDVGACYYGETLLCAQNTDHLYTSKDCYPIRYFVWGNLYTMYCVLIKTGNCSKTCIIPCLDMHLVLYQTVDKRNTV